MSLSYTKSQPYEEPLFDGENDRMWDYVIERHGRAEFETVYAILKKHGDERFGDRG